MTEDDYGDEYSVIPLQPVASYIKPESRGTYNDIPLNNENNRHYPQKRNDYPQKRNE